MAPIEQRSRQTRGYSAPQPDILLEGGASTGEGITCAWKPVGRKSLRFRPAAWNPAQFSSGRVEYTLELGVPGNPGRRLLRPNWLMGAMAERLAAQPYASVHVGNFSGWMAAEQRRIFGLCYRMLEDRDEADMATQDTFLKAYRALEAPGAVQPDEPSKWLSRIAVNTCLDRVRSRTWKFWRRRPRPEDEETILSMAVSGSPSAEDRVFARQIEQRLNEALRQLSPRQRAVFLLKHYEDRRLDEIAEILELDLGTVKAHMARALAKLRVLLKDLYLAGGAHAAGLRGVKRYGQASDR
jgi:RNA polymerase sigma-70 factor (ECF subfamily)